MRGDILHVRASNVLEFLAPGRGWNGPPLPVDLISKPVVLPAGRKFGNIPDPTKITPCKYGFDRTIHHLPIPVEERIVVTVLFPECSFLIPPLWHGTSPSHKWRRCGPNGSSPRGVLQVRRWLAGNVIAPVFTGSTTCTRY